MSLFALPQNYYISTTGYYDDSGKYVKGTLQAFSFAGTIQPVTGKEFENLDIGEKEKGVVKVYSTTQLPIANSGDESTEGALVILGNKYYRLVQELTWDSGIISHYKYIGKYDRDRN